MIGSLGARARWLERLPTLLFLLLVAGSVWLHGPYGEPAWLARAGEIAGQLRGQGGSLLTACAPAEDPRVAPAVLALRWGCPPAAVLAAMRLIGILAGAAAVMLLARGATRTGAVRAAASAAATGPHGILAAALLASSPLWVRASWSADPYVGLALLLLLLLRGGLAAGPLGVALAWAGGWSPWSWVVLGPAWIGRWWRERGERRRLAVSAVIGLGLLGLLHPSVLRSPAAWWGALHWQGIATGFATQASAFALVRGLAPLFVTLHLPGWLLVVRGVPGWPRRVAAGDAAPAILVLLALLALPSRFAHDAPLLLALPLLAGEAGRGARALLRRAPTHRVQLALGAVALIPLWLLLATQPRFERGAAIAEHALRDWLGEAQPAQLLLAHDLGYAPAASSAHIWMPIPFHSIDPAWQRGAYWIGWYTAFDGMVLSERMVRRFLRRGTAFPDVLAFYRAARERARGERAFGERAGQRLRWLRFEPGDDAPLGEGWRERLTAGVEHGLQGEFLARLGAALSEAGHAGAAADLLEEALAAGYRERGIYINLAAALLALDRPLDAGRHLDAARALYPDATDVLYSLGHVLTRVGYWDRAALILARVTDAWPAHVEAHYLLGIALANSGQPAAARRTLEAARELGPGPAQEEAIAQALRSLAGSEP